MSPHSPYLNGIGAKGPHSYGTNAISPPVSRRMENCYKAYLDNVPAFTYHEVVLLYLIYICRKSNGRTEIDPFAKWEYDNVNVSSGDEENSFNVPELTVSERILRGDFDKED